MRRRSFSLKLDTTITGLKIVLSNGTILADTTRNIGTNSPIMQSIDEELIHGTTIEVEYSIVVHNNSSLQCNHLDLITYLPKGFALDKNVRLMTSNATNDDYGWQSYNIADLAAGNYITSSFENATYETYQDRAAIVSSMDYETNGFYIPPGGSRVIKVGITKLVGNMTDLDVDYQLAAEVLGYRDNGKNIYGISTHRRMATMERSIVGGIIHWLRGLFPGNSLEDDHSETSNELYILPPFGEEENKSRDDTTLVLCLLGFVLLEVYVVTQYQRSMKQNKSKKHQRKKA